MSELVHLFEMVTEASFKPLFSDARCLNLDQCNGPRSVFLSAIGTLNELFWHTKTSWILGGEGGSGGLQIESMRATKQELGLHYRC